MHGVPPTGRRDKTGSDQDPAGMGIPSADQVDEGESCCRFCVLQSRAAHCKGNRLLEMPWRHRINDGGETVHQAEQYDVLRGLPQGEQSEYRLLYVSSLKPEDRS